MNATAVRRRPQPHPGRFGADAADRAEPVDPRVPLLQHRLALIDARLAEIAARLPTLNAEHAEAIEMTFERGDLLDDRRVTNIALTDATTPASGEFAERRRRMLDALEAEQRATGLDWVRRLEAEGDWRQARIHRMELVGLREQLDRQIKR